MARQVEAVYEHGVLRPLEPLALAEHQRVRLILEERPTSLGSQSADPPQRRVEELAWIATESRPYAGQWVALEGPKLIAHGPQLALVKSAAHAAGVDEPFFASIPDDPGTPFAGW